MRVRAMKNRKPSAPKANPNADKIDKLKQHRAQIMRDMEQEAEMEGGPVADRYGDMLDKVDRAIAQLSENEQADHEMYENKKKDLKEMFKKIIAKVIND